MGSYVPLSYSRLSLLARRSGKTLSARSREDIKRACALLASAGDELDDLLDELPAREYSTVSFEAKPPEVERWKERRGRQ